MPHQLVEQLRYTRRRWSAAFEGVSEADARRRLEPVNCLSWMVGHLAWHEQIVWLTCAQGRTSLPALNDLAFGQAASTPELEHMWQAWHTVTRDADPYLDSLTPELLQQHYDVEGKPFPENAGAMLQRLIYHYWYHLGGSQVVRRLLGHSDLPTFVAEIGDILPYRPEA